MSDHSNTSIPSDDYKFSLGKTTFEEFAGFPAAGLLDSLQGIAPKFARNIMEWEFADAMNQTTLDVRTQEIVAITMFAVMGATASPILKFRIGTALRAGVTRDEIIDIFTQIGLGAGLPTALAAIRVAEEAFAPVGTDDGDKGK